MLSIVPCVVACVGACTLLQHLTDSQHVHCQSDCHRYRDFMDSWIHGHEQLLYRQHKVMLALLLMYKQLEPRLLAIWSCLVQHFLRLM